ncbi:MAG: hypothetical protein ACTSRL_08485, partial [Candidatus Helarchaeota archaeon]
MTSSSKRVGFDITQKERGRIGSNYQGLRTIFEAEQFRCEELADFPITLDSLQPFQIFFLSCPDSSKLKSDEIDAILNYLSQGGIVIVLSHAGGDQGRRTNLDALTTPLGISFQNNEVLDFNANLGVESYPLVTPHTPHPLFDQISDLCFRIGCSLEISTDAMVLAITQQTAEPPLKPVIGLASHNKGHLIVIGSYEMFLDDVKGGIEYPHNAQFLINLIKWINSDSISDFHPQIPSDMPPSSS